MIAYQWALKWGVPFEALKELEELCGAGTQPAVLTEPGKSEAAVQSRLLIEASQKGKRLWRNNVGALFNEEKRLIRYGLANQSADVNKVLKSSDLIGIEPILICPEHVGHVLGRFLCRETKEEGWQFAATEREIAQMNWITLINALGGNAAFATGEGTL